MRQYRYLYGYALLLLASFAYTADRPNLLLITVDDMNCDSIGVFDCKVPDTTPNIDKLALEGMRFNHAHVTIAVCQPCRASLVTGMYPHNSGIEGFQRLPQDSSIHCLQDFLKDAGYRIGKMGKGLHADPNPKSKWDLCTDNLGFGRNPEAFYKVAKAFFKEAASSDKPFYLNANAQDPHRPFADSDQEKQKVKKRTYPAPSKTYKPKDVVVPGFLPDIPKVRQEIAEYYSSVRRADDVTGAILKALTESGAADNTIVVFLSDHGMALPFAKTNCYLHSTRTPLIVRWPGVIKPGSVDSDHMIGGIDFAPTILEAAGLPIPKSIDGRSIVSILKGGTQENRDFVFTQFHETSGKNRFPMRCVQSKRFGYVFNPWSDGRVFRNESQSGRSFKAMQAAAPGNKKIAARVNLFSKRVLEEFYHFENDPDALTNQVANPEYATEMKRLQAKLEAWMVEENDSALAAFRGRNSPKAVAAFMAQQDKIAAANKKNRKKRK